MHLFTMEKLSKKKHCLKVPSVLCLASHVALSNVTAAKKFFLHNLWTKELKRGVGPNRLCYVQVTFSLTTKMILEYQE